MSEDAATQPDRTQAQHTDQPPRGRVRALSRWLRTLGWLTTFGLFALPWLAVGCMPASFGQQSPGGTTRFNGYQLALGLAPWRDPDHALAADQARPDLLGVQPLALLVLVLAAAAVLASVLLPRRRWRRTVSLALAVAALAGVGAAVAVARAQLVTLVASQVSGPLPDGRGPADYVGVERGVPACLGLLTLIAVWEVVLLLYARWRGARSP